MEEISSSMLVVINSTVANITIRLHLKEIACLVMALTESREASKTFLHALATLSVSMATLFSCRVRKYDAILENIPQASFGFGSGLVKCTQFSFVSVFVVFRRNCYK
ncbi:Hypothetical protein NTJ_15699 [Nesidiocoris tenuis]|uniref:Uncharacterized protein n=1 Tax=Nesidiocoris tenuis TaxID=355587 RepID=A0ABN7BES4_9HEMI|nr:Hypothetical protein NTJ_15699 [Nesidiocoris tenuis]